MVPQSAQEISTAYITPLLIDFLGDARVDVVGVGLRRSKQGTSGSQIYKIAARMRDRPAPVKLLLKLDKAGEINETLFYRDLALRVHIGVPRVLDARVLEDGRGWILMEELQGVKPGLLWTRDDARAVVRDMATLHGANWGNTQLGNDFAWLPRADAASIAVQVGEMRSCVSAIEAAGFSDVLPDILPVRRLRLIDRVLDRAENVLGPLLAPGMTLVHGDYWFHNVQLLPDGRRLLLDWQTVQLFSGIWELVYFLDLWHVIGQRSFRVQIPESEVEVAAWYVEALHERGVDIEDDAFQEALACAYVWQPLTHWLTRYGRSAKGASATPAWRAVRQLRVVARLAATTLASKGALQHMASTWARWEASARSFL